MAGWHCCSFPPLWCATALPCLLCLSVRVCVFVTLSIHMSVRSILLWLPLLPLTCHPCSMTACRRWPGMVWDMEYPWAKLDCKTLPASSTLGMTPSPSPPTSTHPFVHLGHSEPNHHQQITGGCAWFSSFVKVESRSDRFCMLMAKWSTPAVFHQCCCEAFNPLQSPVYHPSFNLFGLSASSTVSSSMILNATSPSSSQSWLLAWASPSVIQTPSTVLCTCCVTPALLCSLFYYFVFFCSSSKLFLKMSNCTCEGNSCLKWIKT